jgi:AAA+ ATPase superfamily predicted ATPase
MLTSKIEKHPHINCTFFEFTGAYKANATQQIKNFIDSIDIWFNQTPTKEVSNWTDAFIFLRKVLDKNNKNNQKIVLFFDEVPWVDKDNNALFLSALGHFWNTYCERKNNFVVILCGSNASWIKNKIFKDNEGPLHNRITDVIAMKPFTLLETKEYLLKEKGFDLDSNKITEIYMAFGGVAKYLSYLKPELTVEANMDALYFNI